VPDGEKAVLDARARAATLMLIFVSLASGGCGSSHGSAPPIQPTVVGVAPQDFLGDVQCLNAPGAMQSYVVSVADVTALLDVDAGDSGAADGSALTDAGGIGEFTLPSTSPSSCEDIAGSTMVIPGHRYVADVDGYDRIDVRPLAPGSPIVVQTTSGEFVAPRWKTSCGRVSGGAVTAVPYLTRLVRNCAPLKPFQ
jgi:hypothetical protein